MADHSIEQGIRIRRSPEADIRKLQTERLQSHVRQAFRSPYYQAVLQEARITPADIRSIDDLIHLPLTSREELDRRNDDFIAVPHEKIVDISLTSGTTSMPVKVPYTAGDLDRLAFNETMAFWGAGIRPQDTCLICVTLDRCFIAGLAYYTGLVKLGAAAVRSGAGQPARQWELIRQLNPTVLVGVPTFLLQIAQWAQEQGDRPDQAGIRSLVTIGEPIRSSDFHLTPLGGKLTEAWNCAIYSSYGATELETGTCECSAGRGGHVHPELCLAEIIDEHGATLPDGQPGELVITPLGVEGFPLIRFRTGDIARKYRDACECGWTGARIGPIEGRLAQRLKYRGTTIYPEAIFQVLQEVEAVSNSYLEVRSAFDLSDDIRVVVGCDEPTPKERLESLLQARLRVRPEVVIKPSSEVASDMTRHGGRKPKKFFDYRR